jgi:hypothetical protein
MPSVKSVVELAINMTGIANGGERSIGGLLTLKVQD